MDNEQHDYQRKRTDWVNNGEHADTPLPRGHFEDGIGQIAADPGIDLLIKLKLMLFLHLGFGRTHDERKGRDEGK